MPPDETVRICRFPLPHTLSPSCTCKSSNLCLTGGKQWQTVFTIDVFWLPSGPDKGSAFRENHERKPANSCFFNWPCLIEKWLGFSGVDSSRPHETSQSQNLLPVHCVRWGECTVAQLDDACLQEGILALHWLLAPSHT